MLVSVLRFRPRLLALLDWSAATGHNVSTFLAQVQQVPILLEDYDQKIHTAYLVIGLVGSRLSLQMGCEGNLVY